MSVITIKDANQKEFSFDPSKVFDINGDISDENKTNINDSRRQRIRVENKVEYVNQKGEALDATQLLRDSAAGKTNIIALDVQTEATHSGKNHNYCVYYEDSMEKDAESFMNPFPKPMLKNHDSWSEPLGRTRQAWFGPSKLTDERSAINLVTRVTDKDAIEKFLDGRYSTVSIGGSMGTVTCNICGKTILKDGKFKFCGHWRGETYKDQVCYWGAKDIEYHEVSTVNNPADDFAQVVKVTVITDEDKNNNDSKKEGVGDMANPTNVNRDSLIAMIDTLLDNQSSTSEGTVTDGAETQETQTQDANQTSTTNSATADEKDNKIKELTDENDSLKAQLKDAVEAKEAAEKKAEDAVKEKEEAVQYSVTMKDQCIELALANKKIIADQIIELELSQKKLEDSKKDERAKELISQSMKDLQSTFDELKNNKTGSVADRQTAAQVKNPTLPNAGEHNSVVIDEQGNPINEDSKANQEHEVSAEDSNKKKSIDDYASNLIKKISKR